MIKGIQGVKSLNEQFGLSCAIDLSSILVDEDYISDTLNYTTSNYSIRIERFEASKISPGDLATIRKQPFTHMMNLVTSKFTPSSPIEIELERKFPRWARVNSSHDDTAIQNQLRSTFALQDLLESLTPTKQYHRNKCILRLQFRFDETLRA